jgi:hypothetical protein
VTPFDANRLAIRYKQIWHGGPATDELRQHFEPLDLERLTATLTRLATTNDHAPTIAQITRAYNDTRRRPEYGWQRPDDTGPPISLDTYLARYPDDDALARTRHPTARTEADR